MGAPPLMPKALARSTKANTYLETSMKATQTLPPTYVPYTAFRPSQWRRTQWVMWICGIALAALSFSFLSRLAESIRPEFQPSRLQFEMPSLERLGSFLVLVLILMIVFAVHELIHALFLWLFTGRFPILVAGAGALAVRLSDWYIPRDQFLVSNLAPFGVLSLVGILLLLVVPQRYISFTVFFTAMNIAGSIADIISSAYLSLHPPSIYLETEGTIYFDAHTGPNVGAEWKLRIRSGIEATIAKLDPLTGAG
jgi:Putative zincin peptidase